MTGQRLLELECVVGSEPAEVCRAFSHATLLRDWLCHGSSTGPEPGGHLFLRWRDGRTVVGRFEHIDPQREIVITWFIPAEKVDTRVRVTFYPEGEKTRLKLIHEIPEDAGVLADGLRESWNRDLENLASVVETGIDLRLARRPRLGILMDEFTKEAAQKWGVPVEKGVLINNTAEGSGARAAGIVKGDVLVSMNGVPLESLDSFDSALVGLQAGDRPVVEFYRGSEKHAVPLELGRFPIPEVPETAVELAAQVRERTRGMYEAIRAQVEGLDAKRAGHSPEPGAWSVNELVAHFILCERDYQSWVADMLNDQPVEDWLQMRPNVQPRISALVQRYPNLAALLAELKYALEETAQTIAAFPDQFVRCRKHLYRRAALWALNTPDHYTEEHKEQIQTAMDAAPIS